MKVLLTGSTGWLGQFVCKQILSGDKFGNETVELFAAYHQSEPEWIRTDHRVKIDLTDAESVTNTIELVRPEVVIHLAAISSPAVCHKDPDGAHRINCPTSLTDAIRTIVPNCLLIYSSTDLVYDGESPPYSASVSLPKPESIYGYTKLSFEEHVLSLKNGVVLRLSNMLGPKYAYRNVGTKFLQWLYESYLKTETVGLRYDEIRSFVLVDDVLEVIQKLLLRALAAKSSCSSSEGSSASNSESSSASSSVGVTDIFDAESPRVFNVGGPVGLSRLDLGKLVVESTGYRMVVIPPPSSPEEKIPEVIAEKFITDQTGHQIDGWRVYYSSNADSIRTSGIYNPRDVTMEIAHTEDFFGMKFTPPYEAIVKSLEDFFKS
jgi:dTDP-4-dehydrorhamnose reductase